MTMASLAATIRGGQAGTRRRICVDGIAVDPKARIAVRPGGVISVHDAGGGGFGDPSARDPDRIRHDLDAGQVTRAWVEKNYPAQAGLIFGRDSG